MKNNAETIKGIDLVIEGLTTIKKSLMGEEVAVPQATKKVEKAQKEEKTPAVEETEGSANVGEFNVEKLNAMKYNEFKKLAASLGVKCTGTRDEIMERILALNNNTATEDVEDEEEVEEPVEEPKKAPSKSDKANGSKKLSKAKTVESTKDEFDEQAEEIAKETPVEDIIEALADVDIKATKKNAVEKLAEALREGLIELDDEDEEEEVNSDVDETAIETDEDEEEDEITADSYFAEYDPKGYNNPEDMSEERAEAIESKVDEILTAYSEGKLKYDDITSYIEDNATEEEIELLGEDYTDDDVLKFYIELIKRTIDNEGEEHEQGEPYEVADKDVCCGHELKYSKKTKQYICEHCGTEYEAE